MDFKVIELLALIITSSLAGAILTVVVERLRDSRKKSRLLLNVNQTRYRLPSAGHTFGELKVFYDGKPYDQLALYRFEITNTSKQAKVGESSIIVNAGPNAEWIQWGFDVSAGVDPRVNRDSTNLQDGNVRITLPELLPKDLVVVEVLATNSEKVDVKFRGDPATQIESHQDKLAKKALRWELGMAFILLVVANVGITLIFSLFENHDLRKVLISALFGIMIATAAIVLKYHLIHPLLHSEDDEGS